MSQSETWDALRLAAEWRLERPIAVHGEAPQMPEPEVEWKRPSSRQRMIRFREDVIDPEYFDDEAPPSRSQQIREYRERWSNHDWFKWWTRGGFNLDLASFDSIMREHYNPLEVSRIAMMRNSVLYRGVDRSAAVESLRDATLRDDRVDALLYAYSSMRNEPRDPIPFRRSLTAALTSLPGWTN